MFSRLDPIFKAQLRHAETMDTRQGINRQDKTRNRRGGNDENDTDNGEDLWEDYTVVSVAALKSFLEQLAGETKQQKNDGETGTENISLSDTPRHEESGPVSKGISRPEAVKAAKAYQKTYRTTHNEQTGDVPASSIPAIDLKPEEIRVIHNLIDDLSALTKQNITEITIHKSESFLQGLVNAVNAFKNT